MSKRSIQLIISDLDGTLLSPSNKLEQNVLYTIEKYKSTGGHFTIATGRPLVTALPILEELQIDLPVILCNGAVIAKRNEIIEQHSFQLSEFSQLLIEAHESGLTVLLFCETDVFIFEHTADSIVYEKKEVISCKLLPIEEMNWLHLKAEKVILMGNFDTSKSIWDKHLESVGDRFEAFQSEYNYLEIVDKSCSKGNAVSIVAEKLGIAKEHIMTIGNELNDLPMYSRSGIGVAVANSREDLKAAADYVCDQAYGQGVVEAIERFVQLPVQK